MRLPPLSEEARLRVLDDYAVLDTAPDETLNEIIALAAAICGTPIALISLVDETRQWFKAQLGITAQSTPRDQAFCAHAIVAPGDGLFTVPDARTDPRFTDNPLVTGEPNVVFYAAAPLIADGGAKLGTLCVIDREARELTTAQSLALETLSRVVMQHLRDKRIIAEQAAERAQVQAALASIGDAVLTVDARGRVTFLNRAAEDLTGWSAAEATGARVENVFSLVEETTRTPVESPALRIVGEGSENKQRKRALLRRRDGREVPIDDSVAPIRTLKGKASGAIVVFRDQAEERRRERELLTFRTFLEESADFISFCTPEGRVQYLNPAGRALVGLAEADPLGQRGAAEFFAPGSADTFASTLRIIERGEYFRGETSFRSFATGETISMTQDAFGVRDETGALSRIATIARDVRSTKATEAERDRLAGQVEVARARLANLFDHAPAFVCTLRGPQHVFEMANPLYRRLVGSSRAVVGLRAAQAVPEFLAQGFIDVLDSVYRTGTPFVGKELPVQLARTEGGELETVFLNFVYQPSRDARGDVDGIDVFGFEVTEQVRARQRVESLVEEVDTERNRLERQEAELRQSEQRLRRIVELSGAGLWEFDLESNTLSADARVAELMGVSAGSPEQAAADLDRLPFPEDRLRIETAMKKALAGVDGGKYVTDFRTGGIDGAPVRWVETHAQTAFDVLGRPTHLVGATIDVTARKTVEEERRRSAARTATLLDTMSDAFFSLDAEWRFVSVNRTFERLGRVRREEIVGQVFWTVFPAAARSNSIPGERYRHCMSQRAPVEFVSYSASLDLWTDTRAMPIEDGGIAAFLRDVTAAKRAEDALVRQAAFERQLIGIVSHDLRTPLNVVAMAATLLRRQDDLSAASAKHVLRIQNASERASRMIRDLLDFTQARLGGGIPLERQPTDLHRVARIVTDEVEATNPDRVLRLRAEGDGQGTWDPDRLGQVVQNLVTNALKHGDPSSAVEVRTRGDEAEVVLSVHNHGVVIPSEKIPVLFEPFERGVAQGDMATRSVGLGLYIVKQVVEAHQGTIEVRSEAEEGTTFTVSLPPHAGGSLRRRRWIKGWRPGISSGHPPAASGPRSRGSSAS